MSEALQALAFVARREARRAMPADRWALVLSLELGWMTPAQGRRYVEAAQRAGVLVAQGDEVALAVDPATVTIRRGFRPDPDALAEPQGEPDAGSGTGRGTQPGAEDGFPGWLQRVAAATGSDAGSVLASVTAVQERFGGRLGALPALLVLAQEAGLDVRGAAQTELGRLTSPS